MILTFLGATPAILGSRVSDKVIDTGLEFSAGIMIVATFTSLILPGIEMGGVSPVIIGFALGALIIHLFNEFIHHEHFVKGYEGPESFHNRLKMI